MADRIEKYRADSVKLQDASAQKIKSELSSLNKWIVKHQYEAVADGDKGKLLSILQHYYKIATERDTDDLKEIVFKVLDDFLKLPEGKLVSAKGKQGALRWLQTLERILNPDAVSARPVSTVRYGVADIADDGAVMLMDLSTNNVLEDPLVISDSEFLVSFRKHFEDLGYLEIVVSDGVNILQVFDLDGSEIISAGP